jgi:prepilin-type N-terminal cleavage/methylation domain-containing protein
MNSQHIASNLRKNSAGFTLVELIVSIAIALILLVFAIAPYNFYANKSKVRLSGERIEQAMNKAKLLAGTGYAPGGSNVDLVVHLRNGAKEIAITSVPAGSAPLAIENPNRNQVEKIRLENDVAITSLGGIATSQGIDIVYRSPTGVSQVWNTPDDTAVPTVTTSTAFS